jgi:hypothetical protein
VRLDPADLGVVVKRFLLVGLVVGAVFVAPPAAAGTGSGATLRTVVLGHVKDEKMFSSGARGWMLGPQKPAAGATMSLQTPSFGSNVDAALPQEDLGGGQSETAIAAANAGGQRRVLAAWNDASAFLQSDSTLPRGSGTGVGYSSDGGRHFRDLIGLPNANPDQEWVGDPSVIRIDGSHFAVGSLYFPSFSACLDGRPAELTTAISIATVSGDGSTVHFGSPIMGPIAGNACDLFSARPNPDIALLDKPFLAYDAVSRTLALSYTRFGLVSGTGEGQIELVRAQLPADPATLRRSAFSAPIVVWPEQHVQQNSGAYPAVAPGGDTYVAWERNIDTNLGGSGDPFVHEQIALAPAGANHVTIGGPSNPRVVTMGQINSSSSGGVRSLDAQVIAGYNRGTGNDFPRIAYDHATNELLVEWNDSSAHPLGDIWMRALNRNLGFASRVVKVNDDSDYTLHFLPAISVRDDGTICSSWYDRRRSAPDSAVTDYYGECRAGPTSNATDFRITTGSTDWTNTSSLIVPNFGDYTDNATDGTHTYFNWSDGRLGVPQPFVDSRP